MIDAKKIVEAATKECKYIYYNNNKDWLKLGFYRGVEWFKETIWHDAKEEPEEHKFIITQWLHEGEICYEVDRTQPKVDWQNHVTENNIIQWCYVEDLLPKGDGK